MVLTYILVYIIRCCIVYPTINPGLLKSCMKILLPLSWTVLLPVQVSNLSVAVPMLDSLYQVDQRMGESCNTSIFVEALWSRQWSKNIWTNNVWFGLVREHDVLQITLHACVCTRTIGKIETKYDMIFLTKITERLLLYIHQQIRRRTQ
jgi:hypothetical protein